MEGALGQERNGRNGSATGWCDEFRSNMQDRERDRDAMDGAGTQWAQLERNGLGRRVPLAIGIGTQWTQWTRRERDGRKASATGSGRGVAP